MQLISISHLYVFLKRYIFIGISGIVFLMAMPAMLLGQAKYKVLIMDGQSDHTNWKQTTELVKNYLQETKLFTVDIARNTPSEGGSLDSFKPNFNNYQVVVSTYNGVALPLLSS